MALRMTKLRRGIIEYWKAVRSFQPNARFFLLGSFLTSIGLSIFSLLFNLYLREAGVNEEVIGRVLSFGSLGTFIMAIPSAYLARKYDSRALLIVTTLLASSGYFVQSLYLSPALLMGANLFVGSVLTISRLLSSPFFMRNSSSRERTHLFAFSMAVGVLAGIIGNLIGGYLPPIYQALGLNTLTSLKYSLATGAVLALFGMFPYSFIREKRSHDEQARAPMPNKSQVTHLLKLCLPYALIGMGAGLVIPFLNLYFKEVFRASTHEIGIYFAVLQALMVLGFLAGPILTRRFGMINIIVGTQLLSIPFMLILALAPSVSLAVTAFWIRGALMNMSSPIQNLFNMEAVPPDLREFTNSMTTLAWNGAWAISSFLGGTIIHRYSFSLSFYITIGLYLSSSLTYYFFFHRWEKKS
jgi:predicted MFS family arabinose efflux permease